MNNINAIDNSVLDTLKGLMKDRFGFLIDTFISKTQSQLEELNNAIVNNNVEMIISITHSMKGSAGSVGAHSMHLLSKDYEDRSRNGDLTDVDSWVDNLRTEYERYKIEIQSYL